MRVKAIFFDLFETLITEFFEGKRISNRHYNYMELLGISNEQYKMEWRQRTQHRMSGIFPDYPSVLRDMLNKHGIEHNEKAIQYLYQERIKEKKIPFDGTRHEVISLLTELKSRGIKLGLISNCTEEEVRYWNQSELAKYMDIAIFSYDVGIAKPDRRIYELACNQLEIEPEAAMFVGDGGSDELDGAHRAGLTPFHAVWFNDKVSSDYPQLTAPSDILDFI